MKAASNTNIIDINSTLTCTSVSYVLLCVLLCYVLPQQWRTSSYIALLQRRNTICDSNLSPSHALFGRPRCRRLEPFTTDSKIIRLISGRVAIFPAAAARQIFDGDCDAANREKISVVMPPNIRPCGFLDKWTEVFPVDKILHRPMPLHWLSLRCFWSNLVTSVDLQLPDFIIFLHQECETNLSFPHLEDFLNIL